MTASPPPDPEEPERNGSTVENLPLHGLPAALRDDSPTWAGEETGHVDGNDDPSASRLPIFLTLALTAATYLAARTAATLAMLLLDVPHNRRVEFMLVSILLGHGFGVLAGIRSLVLLQRVTRLHPRILGMEVSGDLWRKIRRGLAIYLLSLPGLLVVSMVMSVGEKYGIKYEQPSIQNMLRQVFGHPAYVALFYLLAAVGAPMWEELIFRGLFYPLFRSRWGVWGAALSTAFLFALVHEFSRVIQDPRTFLLPIFYLGIVLALIRERTNSVVPGMVVHALHNTLALLMAFNFHQGM